MIDTVRYDGMLNLESSLIFGAAQGIGKALAEYLRGRARLTVSLDRDTSFTDFGVTDSQIGDYRIRADVTQLNELEAAVKGLRHRSLASAFFSAGIQDESQPERTMQVNALGTRNCFAAAAPFLKNQALVVFISSDRITFESPESSSYVASKRSMAEFASQLAQNRPDLRILTLLPGPVDTALFRTGKSDETLAAIEAGPGILKPVEFARMLFEEVLPTARSYPSGAGVRMYKTSGVEWLERF